METQNNYRILVVEDEEDIRNLLVFNLQKKNFIAYEAENGEKALSLIRDKKFDLILLDLMLPGINGLDLSRILKNDETTSSVPIIMLTAKGEESDIVKGLEIGADDYITKPFSIQVLIARINNILRIRHEVSGNNDKDKEVMVFSDLSINLNSREVFVKDKKIDLTFTEFEILKLLSNHTKWVYTRSEIINHIRGDDYIVTDRTIDFQIVGLRKKLGSLGSYIKTVRGVGYRFTQD
ncbi:MAG: DNA-binding response regulator [bacterium TMED198]|nr:MAG: DNA-binding response regulator [bacterium TMED198]|tara:strand:+ start:3269 stop:3976 length:708 start_codon:yes stop_codon:yes gene_type:complete